MNEFAGFLKILTTSCIFTHIHTPAVKVWSLKVLLVLGTDSLKHPFVPAS